MATLLAAATGGCGSSEESRSPVSGTLISDACTPIASWNYRPAVTTGAFGALSVAAGGTRAGLVVAFVDSTGAEVAPAGDQETRLVVADETVAMITGPSGVTPAFDLAGVRPGTTRVEVQIVERGQVVYHSGDIPLIVYAAPENPHPSFLMRKNGIWCVLVADGTVVAEECGRAADPGRLEGVAGEVSEHYFFRRIDPGCTQVNLTGPVYRFTYDFTDDCVARFIIGDHEPELLTIHLEGLTPGDTSVRFHFFRNDTLEFSSPDIPVHVEPARPPETWSTRPATFDRAATGAGPAYSPGLPRLPNATDPTPKE